MAMLVPERSHEPEIMDRPGNSREDLQAVLDDIGTINRRLGGARAVLRGVRPFFERHTESRPLKLLDIGTGGADLPKALVRLATRSGVELQVTAVDLDPNTAAIASRKTERCPQIRVVRADAFSLPFADRSFDLVTASLFAHHFPHRDVVRLLNELARRSRIAVVINDLRRHFLPWLAIHVVSRVGRLHPMVVHDGPLSVLRGFTYEELERAARECGAGPFQLTRSWPFRLILTIDRNGSGAP